jgi:DNA invertase Pin-like site-specific DNA recombinase
VVEVDRQILEQLAALRGRQDDEIRALITKCVEAGVPSQDIADALGISRSTLWRHYGEQLSRNGAGVPREPGEKS